jgi:hypothetical protein
MKFTRRSCAAVLQNGAVKHKAAITPCRMSCTATAERGVVVQAQIPPEPDQHEAKCVKCLSIFFSLKIIA